MAGTKTKSHIVRELYLTIIAKTKWPVSESILFEITFLNLNWLSSKKKKNKREKLKHQHVLPQLESDECTFSAHYTLPD